MKKIKYIKGNQEHSREIENYFVSQGAEHTGRSTYALETFAYFVNPDTGCVDGYSVESWEFKALVEAGIFEELKYPYKESKPKLKVIQGVPHRGDEVIALLKSLGGINDFCGGIGFGGSDINAYYFITKQSSIGCIRMGDEFFKDYDLEVLTLPEKVGPKRKLKVIQGVTDRGHEVINLLESMGGTNTIPVFGRSPQDYYFINNFGCIETRVKSHKFFDDYEIEIMTLPEKVEPKPKLKVIQGVPFRGDEVIALLESLGGKRTTPISGNGSNGYYYINEFQQIDFKIKDSDFFDKYDIEILTLPEGVVKPKLKVIQGDPDRGAEVIKALELIGGWNSSCYTGHDDSCYYFIDESREFKPITFNSCGADFFNDFDIEVLTLPEKVEPKPKLQVIQGDPDRGDEVIALLESIGGKNTIPAYGRLAEKYYYINQFGVIDNKSMSHEFFDKFDIEVLTLPEEVAKPKLQVIKGVPDRGGEVIKVLKTLGGYDYNGCRGINDNCYYFVNPSSERCDGKNPISFFLCTSSYFNDYELEILTLPQKAAKPKLQVVRGVLGSGIQVITLLESLGGVNSKNLMGGSEDVYYYIDQKSDGGVIDYNFDNSPFFNDFDLEVLPLPVKKKYSKEPETPKFVPFVSKVLIRPNPGSLWIPAFYFSEESEGGARWYRIVGTYDTYRECIPYEGNEKLAFTPHDVMSM